MNSLVKLEKNQLCLLETKGTVLENKYYKQLILIWLSHRVSFPSISKGWEEPDKRRYHHKHCV